jgi:hypothetical protein
MALSVLYDGLYWVKLRVKKAKFPFHSNAIIVSSTRRHCFDWIPAMLKFKDAATKSFAIRVNGEFEALNLTGADAARNERVAPPPPPPPPGSKYS